MLDSVTAAADRELLLRLESKLESSVKGKEGLGVMVAQLIRQAIDEVVDAPRTGRLFLGDCEKTEKTYLGTKIEILLRSSLKLKKGNVLDLKVDGVEVDIKHTIDRSWMIPREAVGQVCLLISENERKSTFRLGLIVCRPENLSVGGNQDKKLGISAFGLTNVVWIAHDARYPRNIWLDFDEAVLKEIRSPRAGANRLAELFRRYQRQPIPRSAVSAIARQLDPMKRLRKNGGARSILALEGIALFSGKYHGQQISDLGLPAIFPDEFISLSARTDQEARYLNSGDWLQP